MSCNTNYTLFCIPNGMGVMIFIPTTTTSTSTATPCFLVDCDGLSVVDCTCLPITCNYCVPAGCFIVDCSGVGILDCTGNVITCNDNCITTTSTTTFFVSTSTSTTTIAYTSDFSIEDFESTDFTI